MFDCGVMLNRVALHLP